MKKLSIIYNYDLLKNRIESKGFSQESLALKTGISRTSLNLKLNNKSNFTQTEIKSIAESLNISGENLGKYFFDVVVQKTEQNISEINS